MPVQLVPEGTPGASVIAVKKVNELSFYNLGHKELAEHVGITSWQLTAIKKYMTLNKRPDCYKEIIIGKSRFNRYSQNAISAIKNLLEEKPIEHIWDEYKHK